MTESLETIVPLLIALASGSVGVKIVEWLLERRTRSDREERDAWRRLDKETSLRRNYEEVLHRTRLEWHKTTGIDFDDMPDKPEKKEKDV